MIPVFVTMASNPISVATVRPWVRTLTLRSQRARRRTGFCRRGTVSTLWLRMSGCAVTTVRMSSGRPLRSLMSTSMLVAGFSRRMRRIVSATMPAPPSGRSSRATIVMTTCLRPMSFVASATRRGSSQSVIGGRPVARAQKPQFRVQTLPRIRKVAVPSAQHSPWLGQRASSHTVLSASSRRTCLVLAYVAPAPIRTLSHAGRRPPGPAFSGSGSPGPSTPPSTSGPPGYITSDGVAWPPAGLLTTVSSPSVPKSGRDGSRAMLEVYPSLRRPAVGVPS